VLPGAVLDRAAAAARVMVPAAAADVMPCWPGFAHYWLRESDGVNVCQICGEVAR